MFASGVDMPVSEATKAVLERQRRRRAAPWRLLCIMAMEGAGLGGFFGASLGLVWGVFQLNLTALMVTPPAMAASLALLKLANGGNSPESSETFSAGKATIYYTAGLIFSFILGGGLAAQVAGNGAPLEGIALGVATPVAACLLIRLHSWLMSGLDQAHRDMRALRLSHQPDGQFTLYLRPFSSTNRLPFEIEDYAPCNPLVQFIWHYFIEIAEAVAIVRLEDMETFLAKAWDQTTPLIAIGRPGEHFGAGRTSVSDALWQERVRQLANRASLIMMVPGETEGTQWEMRTVLEPEFRSKTVWIMPRGILPAQLLRTAGRILSVLLGMRLMSAFSFWGVTMVAGGDKDFVMEITGSLLLGTCALTLLWCFSQYLRLWLRLRSTWKFARSWGRIRKKALAEGMLLPEYDRAGGCFLMGTDKRWMSWQRFPVSPNPFVLALINYFGLFVERGFSRLDVMRTVLKSLR